MLMFKILENDLHRSNKQSAVPLIIEVPAREEFLPALVSNASGKFLVSKKLTKEGRIKVGVFCHDADKIDELIPSMFASALDLSKTEKWDNTFEFKNISKAFQYIKDQSFLPAQPHVCIIPSSWNNDRIIKSFRLKNVDVMKYKKYCRIIQMDIPFVVFLSKPEMVGLYTHFLGGPAALLLHNIRRGISFCI